MLAPEDIRRRALNRYPEFLRSLISNESFFPLQVRFGKPSATDDFDKLRREIASLCEANLGCQVEWAEINTRKWGVQRLPERVQFTEETSYLRTIGKIKETARFRENYALAQTRCPALVGYLRERPMDAVEFADAWPGLVEVCCYLQSNPRPNLYCRELPLSVDTKFVENHRTILARMLSAILRGEVVVDSPRFEERFGFRFEEASIRFRLLDPSLCERLQMPFDDVSTPASRFRNLNWRELRVIIVENKMNFLTLPMLSNTIGVWGAGNAAALLHNVTWFSECSLFYWGDVDAQGFEILSRLRACFPSIRSLMMDHTTFERFRHLSGSGTNAKTRSDLLLMLGEVDAYTITVEKNLRLEQERIPNAFAAETIRSALV
jgi:hypothetical protein